MQQLCRACIAQVGLRHHVGHNLVDGYFPYNEQISEVVQWCKAHNLLLNAAKTKELIFDFRHCNVSHVGLPLSIDNSIVDICDNFKYLVITFDCKLNGQIIVH